MKRQLIVYNIVLILSFAVCLTLTLFGKSPDVNYYNSARIALTDDLRTIANGEYDSASHTFYLADLSGKILYTNDETVRLGSVLNVQEIVQTDHTYSTENTDKLKLVFPIERDGRADGFAVFSLDKPEIGLKTETESNLLRALPLIIWGGCALVSILILSIVAKRKVLRPIVEISDSAEAIIAGNLDKTIIQKSTKSILGSEMGRLCFSFEQMRDELKNKERREKALQTSHKELLSCMSHDLRTPISTIKAHAEAIRDGVATSDEKRDKYINTIIGKTDVVSRMISDLLDHSNAECNRLSITFKEFYLNEYFEDISREFDIYCRKYETRLISENSAPEMLIYADKGRLTQVISNLIENAVKYDTNEHKIIWFKISHSPAEKRIYFSVEDNGNGVSLTDISFVFDKFYRAEKSRSTQIPGAGLGLSICKYIVEAHGGEITLKSPKGKGANFTFWLNYK